MEKEKKDVNLQQELLAAVVSQMSASVPETQLQSIVSTFCDAPSASYLYDKDKALFFQAGTAFVVKSIEPAAPPIPDSGTDLATATDPEGFLNRYTRVAELARALRNIERPNLSKFLRGIFRRESSQKKEVLRKKVKWLIFILPLISILTVSAVYGLENKSKIKDFLRDKALTNSDPNCGVAAAYFDEMMQKDSSSVDKLVFGAELLVGMINTSCEDLVDVPIQVTTPTAVPITETPTIVPTIQNTEIPTLIPPTATPTQAEIIPDPMPQVESKPAEKIVTLGTLEQSQMDLLAKVNSLKSAINFLESLSLRSFDTTRGENKSTGTRYIEYTFPEAVRQNGDAYHFIALATGMDAVGQFGERLPPFTVAVITQPIGSVRSEIGPFVYTSNPSIATSQYLESPKETYSLANYPANLTTEIFIQEPIASAPFRPTDRIASVSFVGTELAAGSIENGTVYLCSDGTSGKPFELHEYPGIPSEGSCTTLMWDLNKKNPDGTRMFIPQLDLIQKQAGQAQMFFDGDTNNVGPSIFFRTETSTGRSDIVAIAPFTVPYTGGLLRRALLETEFSDGGKPDPNNIIIGAPDLHFSTNNRYGILLNPEGPALQIATAENSTLSPDTFLQTHNSTGFYFGFDTLATPAIEEKAVRKVEEPQQVSPTPQVDIVPETTPLPPEKIGIFMSNPEGQKKNRVRIGPGTEYPTLGESFLPVDQAIDVLSGPIRVDGLDWYGVSYYNNTVTVTGFVADTNNNFKPLK